MKRRHRLEIGDRVRLRRGILLDSTPRGVAKVSRLMSGVDGGLVLTRPLGGFRCWNAIDLERVRVHAKKMRPKHHILELPW